MDNVADIDRKTASRLLGVSVRTIDRYIRRGKLKAWEENGRVWFKKKEISKFSHHTPEYNRAMVDNPIAAPTIKDDFYRDLYEEARRTLQEYHQKLEQANYRIGQLESQIIHPASLVTKVPERREDFLSLEFFKKEISDKEKELAALKEFAGKEKTSRIIFAVLTYMLLGLLPVLWYLFVSGQSPGL